MTPEKLRELKFASSLLLTSSILIDDVVRHFGLEEDLEKAFDDIDLVRSRLLRKIAEAKKPTKDPNE